MICVTPVRGLSGTHARPGDKSVTHRALLFSSIGDGVTEIEHPGPGPTTCRRLAPSGSWVSRRRSMTRALHRARRRTARLVDSRRTHRLRKQRDDRASAGGDAGGAGVEALVGDAFALTQAGAASRPARRSRLPRRDDLRDDADAFSARRCGRPRRGGCGAHARRLAGRERAGEVVILLSGLWRTSATEVVEPAPSRDHTGAHAAGFGVRCSRVGTTHSRSATAHERPRRWVSPSARPLRAHHLECPATLFRGVRLARRSSRRARWSWSGSAKPDGPAGSCP